MEGIHVGFARRICTDASSKPLPIATYCLRTFHRLGTNPTVKTALHLPWSDFRASFGAEDAGIQEYSKDDKPEITGNRPCQAARIPSMYALRATRSEGVCSPVKIKIPVATADMRRHSDTLRAANAATKERFTGRKRVKRKRLPVVFPSYNFTFFRDTPSRY